MESARPLHEVFTELSSGAVEDPAAAVRDAGHDLPDTLLGDAIAHYAGTVDVEVAEHLAPFVTAHAAGDTDTAEGLELLANTAPAELDGLDEVTDTAESLDIAFGRGSDDLDFGSGAAETAAESEAAVDIEPFEPPLVGAADEAPEETPVETLPELFGSGSPDEADAEDTGLDG